MNLKPIYYCPKDRRNGKSSILCGCGRQQVPLTEDCGFSISCGKICDKKRPDCEHRCPLICHEDACDSFECRIPVTRSCICRETRMTLLCFENSKIERNESLSIDHAFSKAADQDRTSLSYIDGALRCGRPCHYKLLCGKHPCLRTCCPFASQLSDLLKMQASANNSSSNSVPITTMSDILQTLFRKTLGKTTKRSFKPLDKAPDSRLATASLPWLSIFQSLESHLCPIRCPKPLNCKRHHCEALCHPSYLPFSVSITTTVHREVERPSLKKPADVSQGELASLSARNRVDRAVSDLNGEKSIQMNGTRPDKIQIQFQFSPTCQSSCLEASFQEYICPCGRTRILPPLPCDFIPPSCPHPCLRGKLEMIGSEGREQRRRRQPCAFYEASKAARLVVMPRYAVLSSSLKEQLASINEHEATNHPCHPDSIPCPPCTHLVLRVCSCIRQTIISPKVPCYLLQSLPLPTCSLPCPVLLPCGHACGIPCHHPEKKLLFRNSVSDSTDRQQSTVESQSDAVDDRLFSVDHSSVSCRQPCPRQSLLPCGHSCSLTCHFPLACLDMPDFRCTQVVTRNCSCRHLEQKIPCFEATTCGNNIEQLACNDDCFHYQRCQALLQSTTATTSSSMFEEQSCLKDRESNLFLALLIERIPFHQWIALKQSSRWTRSILAILTTFLFEASGAKTVDSETSQYKTAESRCISQASGDHLGVVVDPRDFSLTVKTFLATKCTTSEELFSRRYIDFRPSMGSQKRKLVISMLKLLLTPQDQPGTRPKEDSEEKGGVDFLEKESKNQTKTGNNTGAAMASKMLKAIFEMPATNHQNLPSVLETLLFQVPLAHLKSFIASATKQTRTAQAASIEKPNDIKELDEKTPFSETSYTEEAVNENNSPWCSDPEDSLVHAFLPHGAHRDDSNHLLTPVVSSWEDLHQLSLSS
jgi:hypothetical protein